MHWSVLSMESKSFILVSVTVIPGIFSVNLVFHGSFDIRYGLVGGILYHVDKTMMLHNLFV